PLDYSFASSRHIPALHSFPTRRSSDLRLPYKLGSHQEGPSMAVRQKTAKSKAEARKGGSEIQPAKGKLGIMIPGMGAVATNHDPDRKSTRLNSSHVAISYAVFCLKKKK